MRKLTLVAICFLTMVVSGMVGIISAAPAYASTLPGGEWISGQQDFDLGVWYTLKVRAYSNGGSSIASIKFFGYWENTWHVLCTVSTPDQGTNDTYSCSTDFRMPPDYAYPGGSFTLAFDVIDSSGCVVHHPDGYQYGSFIDHGMGGSWNTPDDGFSVQAGHELWMNADAYPTAGGQPIDHVDFRAFYNNSWHTVCTQERPYVHSYGCSWYPSQDAAGNVLLSFDIIYHGGYVVWHPDGPRSGSVYC